MLWTCREVESRARDTAARPNSGEPPRTSTAEFSGRVDKPMYRHLLRRASTQSSTGPRLSDGTRASERRGEARIPPPVGSGGRPCPRTRPTWRNRGAQWTGRVARCRHQDPYADDWAFRRTGPAPSRRRSTMAPCMRPGASQHRRGVERAREGFSTVSFVSVFEVTMNVRAANEADVDRLTQIWYDGWHDAHARI